MMCPIGPSGESSTAIYSSPPTTTETSSR
jgi:hypothetical protein